MMQLTSIQQRFILHWGEMGTRWGINRTVAQIHALLYLAPRPLHAEDIADTLSLARSNVSTSLKELQGWRLVRLVHVLDDKRDHFESLHDVWEMFRIIADERKRREIDPTRAMLHQLLTAPEAGLDPLTKGRLEALVGVVCGGKRLATVGAGPFPPFGRESAQAARSRGVIFFARVFLLIPKLHKMNINLINSAHGKFRELPPEPTWFVADWRRMLFVHFHLPPAVLAPHVPHALDLHEGRAWVSLVFFRLEGLRPPGSGALGRALFRPISDHAFLNVRTYVRAEAGPGIHFLAEWIPNRLSAWFGPRTYGLPYRLGSFDCDLSGDSGGVGRIAVHDPALGQNLSIAFPTQAAPLAVARPGTTASFLLERYTAYTWRKPVRRFFQVSHPPWHYHAADWLRTDTALIAAAFPWFRAAEFHSAHLSPGVGGVRMSRPRRLAEFQAGRRVAAERSQGPGVRDQPGASISYAFSQPKLRLLD